MRRKRRGGFSKPGAAAATSNRRWSGDSANLQDVEDEESNEHISLGSQYDCIFIWCSYSYHDLGIVIPIVFANGSNNGC